MRLQCVFNASSMRLQCAFNAPSMRLQCAFNAPSMRLNPRPRLLFTVLLQSSPSPENIFKNLEFSKKWKMTPPRFVHWAHMSNKFSNFCSRLSVGEKGAARFFKIARARARARADGSAGFARLKSRPPRSDCAILRIWYILYIGHILVHSMPLGRNGRACARTGHPPTLSTVEHNPRRRSRAARAGVAPWEHREAMWADCFRVHCPNPQNVAGQRRHRRWSTAQFVVSPPPPLL